MFHRCLLQLAKTKSSTPRRHVLRRPLRRSGSNGSGVTGASRHNSTARTAARIGAQTKTSGSSVSLSAARGKGGGGRGPHSGSSTAIDVEAAAAAEAGNSGAAVPLAAHDGLGGASADSTATSSTSARRPLYRLATAVATVVVPPTTNVYLQGMKHLLTPATPSPSTAFIGGWPSVPSVSIVEEYYTSKKGPLFATAVVAGTNAVKQVSSLVPFCYPTPIQRCSFTFRRRQVPHPPRPAQMPHRVVLRRRTSEPGPQQSRSEYSVLYCFCTVATENKGGVEMEALTGATMASITLYDMLKGLPGAQEDGLSLGEAFVLAKRGGRNDFTKLLMSEPDRPLVESGMRPGEAEMHALPSSSGVVSKGSEHSSTSATHAPQPAATGARASVAATPDADRCASTNAAQSRAEGEMTSEEMADEQDHHPATKRVIHRPAPAAATAHDVFDESAAAGDTDAWWRSSKHEKRLQELYPRRKYGDNARVVPTNPTPMSPDSPVTRTRTRTNPLGTPDSGAEVAAAPATLLAAQPKPASKASVIREGRAPIPGKEQVVAAVLPKAAGRDEPAGTSNEAGEADEDDEVVEYRRSSNRRLVKKSSRVATPTVEADDDDYDDQSAATAEEADEEAMETTAYAVDEVEEEEAAMAAAAKKRRRGAVVTAASKGHASVVAARLPLSGKRPQTGHKRYLAELRSEVKSQGASEDDPLDSEEDEAAEDRSEEEGVDEGERAPTKSSAAAATRKVHAYGTVAGKRAGRSATEFSRSTGAGSRKQRLGRAAPKKGRAQAELDDDNDNDIAPEEQDDDIEKGDDEAGNEGEDAASAAAAKRRGKAVTKQIRSSAPRKGGAMRPVRHDSWDTGFTRRSRHNDEAANADQGYDDKIEEADETVEEEDGEGEEEEDEAPPPLPPRNRLKKPLKRAASKRR